MGADFDFNFTSQHYLRWKKVGCGVTDKIDAYSLLRLGRIELKGDL